MMMVLMMIVQMLVPFAIVMVVSMSWTPVTMAVVVMVTSWHARRVQNFSHYDIAE